MIEVLVYTDVKVRCPPQNGFDTGQVYLQEGVTNIQIREYVYVFYVWHHISSRYCPRAPQC